MVTASVVTAVSKAVTIAAGNLLTLATNGKFKGKKPDELAFGAGRVHLKDSDPSSGVPFEEIVREGKLDQVMGIGENKGNFTDVIGITKPKKSSHSFGAHFVEVTWQPEIARVRVSRVLTVIDAGKIINTRTGRNQIEGAVAMGIGMALFEQTHYDPRNGAPINSNLADYVVAVNADVPKLEVEFLDYPDFDLNELGARGIGEIGLAGVAAAICGAVHHATGIRVRDLPIKIEDLLASRVS
jgi:xanthine dehydrogenase YagR molybdenum-binding subunit